MRILFYPLIFCVLYKQIKTYLDNKRKLTDIFYSINHINKKLKKIESLIHKKSVNFNDTVEKFNLHYDEQINNLKNKIINIILDVLKKYSEVNKIDLILDSNNYILSSNSINITDLIKNQVNKQIIEINFEKYQ